MIASASIDARLGGTTSPSPSQLVPHLVELPPGSFIMGETPGDKFATDTERPAHRLSIAYRFALGRAPVTVADFRAFAPNHVDDLTDSSDLPVVNVSWHDAQAYCAWLRAETGLPFRLPSEAEWEYACRAGTRDCFSCGSDLALDQANYLFSESGERVGLGHRTPIRAYPKNGFGLYDLHGNVCEWVEDAWHPHYDGAPADGSAWLCSSSTPSARVIRGGAWDYLPRLLRCAWRDSLCSEARRDNLGFRIAFTLPPTSPCV